MAINDNTNVNNSSAIASAMNDASNQRKQNQNQNQQRQQGNRNMQNDISWGGLGRLIDVPLGRNPASEVLSNLEAKLSEVYKSAAGGRYQIKLIPIDMNNEVRVAVSALVVAATCTDSPKLGVGFHTLILEGSVDPIPSKFENINGQNVEIMRLASEGYDEAMRAVVYEEVSKAFPNLEPVDTEACLVPRAINLDDKTIVHNLATNALYAIVTELVSSSDGFQDVSIPCVRKDANLTARVTFGNAEQIDAVGSPQRSDVVIEVIAGQQNQQGQFTERQSKITQISGYLDLMWDPVAPQANPYAPMQYQQQPQNASQLYAPNFVITGLESQQVLTLPAQLLALATVMTLNENSAWARGFAPKLGADMNVHDIGAIGIEANIEKSPSGYGSRIDTHTDSFRPETLMQLLGAYVRPNLMISLDVSEAGPSTWYNSVFPAVAAGNAKAVRYLIEAADYLTAGEFSKVYQGGKIALDAGRIHMGYFEDRNGRHDIREIDYLAVANMVGEKDATVIRQYSDTWLNLNVDPKVRIAERRRLIQNLCPGQVTYTGYGRRVIFGADFLFALLQACVNAGLDLRTQYPYAEMASIERASGSFASSALLNNSQTGLFNKGFGAQQPSRSGGFGSFGRWQG